MNRSVFAAVGVTLAATGFAAAAELPLRQVILSNSGLAQFTHGGPVAGNSTIELPVRLDQVDDILKSLTVFDRAGAVGTVSLPGKTPLPELFRDLPFGPEALNSSPDLLNALVGSEIEISGPVTAKGRVFRVVREQVALPNNGGTTARHRLTLMTPDGSDPGDPRRGDGTALHRSADPPADRAAAGRPDREPRQGSPHRVGRLPRRRHARCRASAMWSMLRSGRRRTASCCRKTAARTQGPEGAIAGLGGGRESDRRRLEGHRSDAGFRQSGGVASAALYRVVCKPAGSAGLDQYADRAAHATMCRKRPRRRARPTCAANRASGNSQRRD